MGQRNGIMRSPKPRKVGAQPGARRGAYSSRWRTVALALAMTATTAMAAEADPNVTMTVRVLFNFEGSDVDGIGEVWTFDAGFSAELLKDFDADNDGALSDAEVKAMGPEVMKNLADFPLFHLCFGRWSRPRQDRGRGFSCPGPGRHRQHRIRRAAEDTGRSKAAEAQRRDQGSGVLRLRDLRRPDADPDARPRSRGGRLYAKARRRQGRGLFRRGDHSIRCHARLPIGGGSTAQVRRGQSET